MLRLSLPKLETWDEKTEEFKEFGGITVELEHSLYTISEWESKWKIPFATQNGLTRQQLMDYIMNYMCQTPNVPQDAWLALSAKELNQINEYLEDPACATTIKRLEGPPTGGRKETVSAELIYYYMTQFNIPFECEHWHLNKLMKLIDVCAIKNTPPKKMGKREAAIQQAKLNAARRAKSGSRG